MDLHSLPPQGDIRPSQLMAKLTNTLPHGTPTNTDLFYSFSMFRMPQYLREVLAANEYATARDMAVTADRVWDLRQSAPPPPSPRPTDPASGPRRCASAAATPTAAVTPAATPTAAAHRASAAAEPRHLTIRNSPIMAFVGTTTNIRSGQNVCIAAKCV